MAPTYINIVPLTATSKMARPYFTYVISSGIKLTTGMLVRIPFRNRTLRGVVLEKSRKKKFAYPIKEIIDVVSPNIFISQEQITLAGILSERYGVSLSSIFKLMLPSKITKKSKGVNKKNIKPKKKKSPLPELLLNQNDNETIAYIQKMYLKKKEFEQILVIYPTVARLKHAYETLTKKLGNNAIIAIHSGLTGSVYTNNYLKSGSGNATIILSLKNGPLLSFANLSHILVVDKDHSGHKQWDQKPFLHAVDLIDDLRAVYPLSSVVLMSYSLNTSARYKVAKESYRLHSKLTLDTSLLSFVDMSREYSPLHNDVVSSIQTNDKEKIAVIHNRVGLFKRFSCLDCEWISRCLNCALPLTLHEDALLCHRCEREESIPPFCQHCNGSRLKSSAPAVTGVEQFAKKTFSKTLNAATFMTDALLSTPLLPEYSSIVIVNADIEMNYPAWNSTDKFIEKILHLTLRLKTHGVLYIQTRNKNTLQSLFTEKGLENYYKKEIETRRQFNYPPFTDLVLITKKIKKQTDETFIPLEVLLQKYRIPYFIYPAPIKKGSMYLYLLLLKTQVRSEKWYSFVKKIPTEYSIDIHPQSI